MRQSSPAPLRLPAWLPLLFLATARLSAQEERPLTAPAELHREPDGAPLVSLPAGAPVEPGRAQGDWHQVTVEGWMVTSSTAPTKRDGFDLVVTPGDGENLRRAPNGPLLGRVREGTLLERVGERGKWTRVRREGWVPKQAVQSGTAAQRRAEPPRDSGVPQAAQTPAPQTPSSTVGPSGKSSTSLKGPSKGASSQPGTPASGTAPDPDAFETARQTVLAGAPDGPQYGTLQGGAPARVVARSGDWVRVEVSGWVRDSDLAPAKGGLLAQVSAADLRANPDAYVGQILQWRLQLISVPNADELRPELPPGQPYLLTRGPLPEPGFVYVMIPVERAAEFRALAPLAELTLQVRLKAARTRYLTTPVAELVSVVSGLPESR